MLLAPSPPQTNRVYQLQQNATPGPLERTRLSGLCVSRTLSSFPVRPLLIWPALFLNRALRLVSSLPIESKPPCVQGRRVFVVRSQRLKLSCLCVFSNRYTLFCWVMGGFAPHPARIGFKGKVPLPPPQYAFTAEKARSQVPPPEGNTVCRLQMSASPTLLGCCSPVLLSTFLSSAAQCQCCGMQSRLLFSQPCHDHV